MRLKFPARLIGIITSVVVVMACNLIRSPSPLAPPTFPATSEPVQSGIPILASPIRFVIPAGLGVSVSAETIDVVTDQSGAPWDVAPAHLQLTLQGYPLNNSFHVPQIFVYPALQYVAANQSAAESLKRLQAILSKPGAQYTNDDLPYVPFFNAGQVFAAQEKVIQFNGGAGLRVVTQYASDVSPINNGGLFYHFEGLTNDGKYYVVGILPASLPFLPADNNPASTVPAGGIPFPQANAPGTSFDNYFKQVNVMINNSTADQFNPSLNTLDALTQSISTQ